jgi:uncharacterized protein YdiU (UPF0061 family)
MTVDDNPRMENPATAVLRQRIIETADEYHAVAEDQWFQAIDLAPESDEAAFEFRRLIRAALVYYMRAYLALDLIETDAEQLFEDLLEIVSEQQPDLGAFFEQNDVAAVLDEDAASHLSNVFAVAEAVRTALLEGSNQLAATLAARFLAAG